MTDKLPPNLLALFAPRPPLRYLPHCDHAPEQRRTAPIDGVGAFLEELRKPDPDYVPTESWLQRKDRRELEKKQKQEQKLKEGLAAYNPENDTHIRGDPYKTLFVARLSYDVKEPDLEREFGRFGPIERIRIVRDKNTNKHRGYAFIVYEREKDMKAAYKETDGIRIKDRRVCVDVERGRTVKGWKPRRLGGGLGGRGYTKAAPARGPAGPPFGGPGGDRFGDRGRGGFRGGFRGGRGGFGGPPRFDGPPGGGRGPRGGLGYQGGGGRFGGPGGENGSFGGEAPPNAPTGPGGRRGGYGGGFGDRGGDRGGGDRGGGDRGPGGHGGFDRGGHDRGHGGYDRRGGGYDRDGPPRDRGYGMGDRGGDRFSGHRDDRDDHSGGYGRKRPHDDGGYSGGGGDRHRRRY